MILSCSISCLMRRNGGMNKGLYFMGWPRGMWNYHPSLPMKNLHMIEDIEESMEICSFGLAWGVVQLDFHI